MSDKVSRLDYCQYLLVSQINYTLTNFADHCDRFSHDAINRYLRGERITPRLIWDNVLAQLTPAARGYVIFDDTVLDKNYSDSIELVRRQYSGNAHSVIKGIGVVTCVYVNPETDQFWLIDYRIYDPEGDGKTKLDHVREMLSNLVYEKELPFQAVLMDAWYATKDFVALHRIAWENLLLCPCRACSTASMMSRRNSSCRMSRSSSRSLSRRRPSQMTSLAEEYEPLATFSLTNCSSPAVRKMFTRHVSRNLGIRILSHIPNPRPQKSRIKGN